MTDQGPPCVVCKAEMVYVGQITKKGHPQDGRHLYQCPTAGCTLKGEGRTAVALKERYEGVVSNPSPVYEI